MTSSEATGKPNGFSIRQLPEEFEQMLLPVGTTVGKYCIIEEIDRGGMAAVYKAVQTDLDRFVALKIMPSNISLNSAFMERFQLEAHAIAQLSHPSIVSIHEVGRDGNVFFLAMEYVPGPNLFNYLYQSKPKLIEVLDIISALADALSFAHEQKIIHRDLKLNNVIMKNGLTPVLIDFGLAKMLGTETQAGLTRTGELIGSPAYMAPERLNGLPVDFRSDVCSLGIMLYEMLTFKNPYLDQRNLHQTAMNVMEAAPIAPRKLVKWLPAEIEAITLKAMARDPAARYQSMEEFRLDVNRYRSGKPVEARPPTLRSKTFRFVKKYWPALSVLATVVTFSALFAFSLYIQSRKEMSHWQLLYSHAFSATADSTHWTFAPEDSTAGVSGNWHIKNGMLTCRKPDLTPRSLLRTGNTVPGTGTSFARFEQHLNHEIRIEFDAGAYEIGDLYNAGLFLFGETPDSGYRIYINRRGDGGFGIVAPGNDYLFRSADPAKIELLPVNHIVVESIQDAITFTINGTLVAKVYDCMPQLGPRHERLGFFIDGSGAGAWFDNLKIFRRAVPATPSPTLVAERYMERGDFQDALEEYRALLIDFKNTERAREIRLSIADCLIRLRRPDEALKILAEEESGLEPIASRKLLYEAAALRDLGRHAASDSMFRQLSAQFPGSAANLSSMARAAVRVGAFVRTSRLDSAADALDSFSVLYKRNATVGTGLLSMITDACLRRDQPDSAIAIAEKFTAGQDPVSDELAECNDILGRACLAKGQRSRATELFNRCITARVPSKGVWDSWLGLAEIYQYDMKKPEARLIFKKILHECPRTLPYPWMAALRLGETMPQDSQAKRADFFRMVAGGSHSFPLLRLAARYYLSGLDNGRFITMWSQMRPDECSYYFCLARKAKFQKADSTATDYLQKLKQCAIPQSWEYAIASRAINNLWRW